MCYVCLSYHSSCWFLDLIGIEIKLRIGYGLNVKLKLFKEEQQLKKIITVFCVCICVLSLAACGNQQKDDTLRLGINVIITKIDTTNKTITVKDGDNEDVLGKKCIIDCSKIPIMYCNYETNETKSIDFGDLQVNDEVLLGIRDSEIEKAKSEDDSVSRIKVEQIQLATQRLNNK